VTILFGCCANKAGEIGRLSGDLYKGEAGHLGCSSVLDLKTLFVPIKFAIYGE
jgi:hypothetical protein